MLMLQLSGLDPGDIEEGDLEGPRPKSSTPREVMEGEGHIDRVEVREQGTPPQQVSPRGEVIPAEVPVLKMQLQSRLSYVTLQRTLMKRSHMTGGL